MRSYGQYCPVAKATEVLGDRWTLLIVSEMTVGAHRFNDIARGLPRISRSLLSQRLRFLERAGIVDRRVGSTSRSTEYHLTAAGEELIPLITALGEWGARWAFGEPQPDELHPILLLWWMRGRVNREAFPPGRTVVGFEFRDGKGSYWLLLHREDVSVCLQDPGFDLDLRVDADLFTLYEVWVGRRDLAGAMVDEMVRIIGPTSLKRAFPSWFALSPIAYAVRAAREASAEPRVVH